MRAVDALVTIRMRSWKRVKQEKAGQRAADRIYWIYVQQLPQQLTHPARANGPEHDLPSFLPVVNPTLSILTPNSESMVIYV